MRFTSLRSTIIAGGATAKPSSAINGSVITMTMTSAISDSRSRPMALISRLSTCVTAVAPAVSRARNSEECRSEKNAMFSLISLANSRPLVVGEDRVADLRQDHGVPVGRRTLDGEDDDGDQRQDRDAAHILVDIGLVDDLAEQIGGTGGGRRRKPHQREREQIAPPVGEPLFGDQTADQDRRAIGVVGDFSVGFSLGSSVIRVPLTAPADRPARQGCCGCTPCLLEQGFSSQISA